MCYHHLVHNVSSNSHAKNDERLLWHSLIYFVQISYTIFKLVIRNTFKLNENQSYDVTPSSPFPPPRPTILLLLILIIRFLVLILLFLILFFLIRYTCAACGMGASAIIHKI
jgi:hypothetical protein